MRDCWAVEREGVIVALFLNEELAKSFGGDNIYPWRIEAHVWEFE